MNINLLELENLQKYVQSLVTFSTNSWDALIPALEKRTFKKGEYLLEEGKICDSLFYIDQGYCKSFYIVDGSRKNTAFYFENDIATNIASFGSGEKSNYSIIACELVVTIIFNKQKLFEASHRVPEIESLGRACIRLFAAKQEEFSNLFKIYTAKERLEYIEHHHPYLIEKVSLTQLSSFLGVARETLSRIRKQRVTINIL